MPTHPVEPKTRYLAVKVEPTLAAAFERLALNEDRTISQEMRRAMRAHLERQAKRTNEDGR